MDRHHAKRVNPLMVITLAGLLAAGIPGSASAASVGIGLRCYSNPETTTIRNNTSGRITIQSIRSTYQPQDFEPFVVNKRLGPGKSITYQTGFKATTNVLTRNFIYYNNDELDGVRVSTSIGIFRKRC